MRKLRPKVLYALSKGDSTKIGGNGVLTEVFYDKDAGTVKITIMHVYGGEISSVRAATAFSKDANVTVTQNAGRGGNYEPTSSQWTMWFCIPIPPKRRHRCAVRCQG